MTKQEIKKSTYDFWDLLVKLAMVVGGIALAQSKWGAAVHVKGTAVTVSFVLGVILEAAVAFEFLKLKSHKS